jgi:hypothetical protein
MTLSVKIRIQHHSSRKRIMLKRYAVLMGSTEGATPLPEVRSDLALMKNYLMSSIGGGWLADEIRIFLNRPALDILKSIDRLKRNHPDYLLFYWNGHGLVVNSQQILQPDQKSAMALDCFFNVAPRQLMILDTCRERIQTAPSIVESSYKQAMAVTDREKRQYRRVYDHYVAGCEPSLQIAYACQPGARAGVSLYGSFYTMSLVQRALRWELPSRHKHGFASIRRLMRKSTINGAQPDYYHSGGGIWPRYFPFAVGLYR